MAQFARGIRTLIGDEAQMYFSDLYEHLDELSDKLDVSRESLAGARDLYLSVSANRTNESMRVLAIIATIMMPLTFLTGVYGMNVDLPGRDSEHAFTYLAGGMFALAVIFLVYFKKRKWI